VSGLEEVGVLVVQQGLVVKRWYVGSGVKGMVSLLGLVFVFVLVVF